MSERREEYIRDFAGYLAKKIVPPEQIKPFIGGNSDLIGGFAEAQVRNFTRYLVKPLRVSRGAVLTEDSSKGGLARQVDIIIWIPNPLPPLVEIDDYALVDWRSSMGILEIKSSAYGVGQKIEGFLDMESDLTAGRKPAQERGIPAALGVVVWARRRIADARLRELIELRKAVVLLYQEGETYVPNTDGIVTLVNFLAGIRNRAQQLANLRISPIEYILSPDNGATAWY